MGIVTSDSWATTPSADTNVSLSISERANEFFQFGVILDGIYPDNIPFGICMNAALKRVFLSSAGFMPSFVQLLHEERISFASRRFADLLNSHVAPSTDNVTEIYKIVAWICSEFVIETRQACVQAYPYTRPL